MDTQVINQKEEKRARCLRKANECFIDTGKFLPPPLLFDEFWREGELALFFGAAGAGKSVLAVQIADALARGRALDGFRMPTRRRKVLYVDLDQSDAQFRERYWSADRSADTLVRKSAKRKKCAASQATLRTGVSALRYRFSENLYRDRPLADDDLCEWLRETVGENGFEVVIVDDLSAVKRTHDGTRETLAVMRRLKRLRDELGISILVLTGSDEPRRGGAAREYDLGRSRVLCNTADSVFAIRRGRHSADKRYLVQTRSRSAPIFWDEENAPTAHIARMENGLLGFQFDERFAPQMDEEKRQMICRVRSMHDRGVSYRAIAEELGISKSQAARLYKKWTPALVRDQDDAEDDETLSDEQTAVPKNAWGLQEEAYRGEHTDRYLVSIGMRPVWKEKLEAEQKAKASEIADSTDPPGEQEEASEEESSVTNSQLLSRLDGYGREIFVESEDPNGKPTVWYQFDKKGARVRFVRTISGISTERLKYI